MAGSTERATAAGVITHAAIIERALDLVDSGAYPALADLLHEYREVVANGAMFPDWAFTLSEGDLAEAAHDTLAGQQGETGPFRAALTATLLNSFQQPYSQDDRKAIAFLMGVISHQDADIPYHFDDHSTVALLPLAVRGGIPHWAFELGSDLYLAPSLTSGVDWFIPEKPVLAAYQILDAQNVYGMNAVKLRLGRAGQQVQYALERAAAGIVDPCMVFGVGECREDLKQYYALIETYPRGGLEDAARRTANLWQDTWTTLEGDSPAPSTNGSSSQPAFVLHILAEPSALSKSLGGEP